MSTIPWYRRVIAIIIASIISPVIGLILLWFRKETKILWRSVWTIPMLIMGVIHYVATLILLMNLGFIEPSGDMLEFSFFIKRAGTESHYSAIEESRADQSVDIALASEANELDSTYWINFWGPNFDGKYDQTPVRTNINEQPWEIVWKQPIGGGYASFTIAKGVAYTIEQRRDEEVVTAYDITNGHELWNYAWTDFFHETMGGEGPRATTTWDDGRLYALGGNGHFVCLNAETGEMVWEKNILEENGAENIMWGMSASPLVFGDLVITVPGGADNMMVAYDKLTGEKRWGAFNDTIKYSSPFKATVLGVEQIIYTCQERVMGVNPKDGTLLWDYYYGHQTMPDHKIGQPIVIGEDTIFASSGYGYGCDLFKVIQDGETFKTEKLWQNRNMKNRFSSPIFWDGYIYGLDETVLVCLDMDGKRKWKGGRYGHGQIVMADGTIIVLSEQGELSLVDAKPVGYNEIGSMKVIDGKTWNFPAMSDGYLLVRNAAEMACLNIID